MKGHTKNGGKFLVTQMKGLLRWRSCSHEGVTQMNGSCRWRGRSGEGMAQMKGSLQLCLTHFTCSMKKLDLYVWWKEGINDVSSNQQLEKVAHWCPYRGSGTVRARSWNRDSLLIVWYAQYQGHWTSNQLQRLEVCISPVQTVCTLAK